MANLDNLIKKEEAKKSFQFALIGGALALAGEGMQLATGAGLMDYNWMVGHLSDFGIVFQGSTVVYYFTPILNKYVRMATTLVSPIVATIHEYSPLFNAEDVTDHADTALFWLGWATSIGGIKYLASRKAKKIAAPEYNH